MQQCNMHWARGTEPEGVSSRRWWSGIQEREDTSENASAKEAEEKSAMRHYNNVESMKESIRTIICP